MCHTDYQDIAKKDNYLHTYLTFSPSCNLKQLLFLQDMLKAIICSVPPLDISATPTIQSMSMLSKSILFQTLAVLIIAPQVKSAVKSMK